MVGAFFFFSTLDGAPSRIGVDCPSTVAAFDW